MLYILVLLLPFLIFIILLARQNKRLSDEYVGYYRRVWALAAHTSIQTAKTQPGDLDVLITDDSIKSLELDLSLLEEAFELKKSSVVSNTFTPKKKKLEVLAKRIKKLETKKNQEEKA